MTLFQRSRFRWAKRSPSWLAIALSLALISCGTPIAESTATDTAPTSEPNENVEQPTEVELAEAQAQARAEWEAQRKQIQSVLSSKSREELIGESSTKGPLDAEVVLMKFSDFQCPYCATAAAEMKTFTAEHEDDVLYVYKQFPLVSIHDKAMEAAKASWAAGQQDQFWLYHDGLFAYQDKIKTNENYFTELAEQIGLDMEQFERDHNSPEAQAAIDQDIALAEAFGIRGTPTFVMNDLLIPGNAPLSFFEEATTRLKAGETIE